MAGDSESRNRALEQGRQAFARREWHLAYRILADADRADPLSPSDLDLLVWAAALTGRNDEMLQVLDRLYQTHAAAERHAAAARAAFWLGMRLLIAGEMSRAQGWLGRAHRSVERQPDPCVEAGYLLLPAAFRDLATEQWSSAETTALRAAEIGEEFGDPNLVALARGLQGQAAIHQGRVESGLSLLDEAMLPVTNGELLPFVTGIIYCNAIGACLRIQSISRSREWTKALAAWCDAQPDLIPFATTCLAHRSEILCLAGSWDQAIDEARRAADRVAAETDSRAAADVWYQQAEILRLRGELAAAEDAYRQASERGRDAQPGLALLRVGQNRLDDAVHGIERALADVRDPLRRTRLLPAYVEIMLAAGNLDAARSASGELEVVAKQFDTEVLDAIAAHARGAVLLADGDAAGALAPLRAAFTIWNDLGAPYLAARIRVLIGRACQALGDRDGTHLEWDAARATFQRLGAVPDLDRLESVDRESSGPSLHRLTDREVEVLRLVATGKTNKVIAGELRLSEKTIDRHVSNIFTKLGVSSRAAATAYAYQHRLT
jgi:DNA-binding NarL/FixJ family response regulator